VPQAGHKSITASCGRGRVFMKQVAIVFFRTNQKHCDEQALYFIPKVMKNGLLATAKQ